MHNEPYDILLRKVHLRCLCFLNDYKCQYTYLWNLVSILLFLSLKDRFIFLSENAHVPVSTTGLQQVLLAVIIQRKSYWP